MLRNLTDILSEEGKVESLSVPYEAAFFQKDGVNCKVLSDEPIAFVFTNTAKGEARIEGKGSIRLQCRCDRCLKRVDIDVPVLIDENVREENADRQTGDEQPFWHDAKLDTELLITNEILVNFPAKILCKEDCKGLCPNCGKDLNEGDCGCDTFVPDPRWAALSNISLKQ
ncbi:MAG: DUF177 domain-containing protein [Lachnospiraceae bacterium]|nr:DUF177 domain-containing protein [Lachnospiraceae bacterium]